MLSRDPFGKGVPESRADILVDGDREFTIGRYKVKYRLLQDILQETGL